MVDLLAHQLVLFPQRGAGIGLQQVIGQVPVTTGVTRLVHVDGNALAVGVLLQLHHLPRHERIVLLKGLVTRDVKNPRRFQSDGIHAVEMVTQGEVARHAHHVATRIIRLALIGMLEDDAHHLGLEPECQMLVVEVFQPLGVILDDTLSAPHVASHVVVALQGMGAQHGEDEGLGKEPLLADGLYAFTDGHRSLIIWLMSARASRQSIMMKALAPG